MKNQGPKHANRSKDLTKTKIDDRTLYKYTACENTHIAVNIDEFYATLVNI